jgi:hypothetical protein
MTESSVFSFDPEGERRNCLFAVPKKGRLFEQVNKLLGGSGLDYQRVLHFIIIYL